VKYKIAYRAVFPNFALYSIYIYIYIYYTSIYVIKCAVYLPYIKMMQRRRMRDGTYITHGMGQECLKITASESEGKTKVEDPGVDGRLIFELIERNRIGLCGLGSSGLG
jgi:hypothetical protein